jgi:hypothetical protein
MRWFHLKDALLYPDMFITPETVPFSDHGILFFFRLERPSARSLSDLSHALFPAVLLIAYSIVARHRPASRVLTPMAAVSLSPPEAMLLPGLSPVIP